MTDELNKIKKYYGENFAKLCRDSFSTILENEGTLLDIITSTFAHSHFLYEDIISSNLKEEFINHIYSLTELERPTYSNNKKPYELLSEAGYELYECKTDKEIQSFKKYYAVGEELCTFSTNRLNEWYVYFAVKKNADKIKREDFLSPDRQDEYGTSVISIQFLKGDDNFISIKNRYNHTVKNPDATFSNNLDNIIIGLTSSFERCENLNIKNGRSYFELLDYIMASDGKYYRYNYEIDNIYYCSNNIIIDNGKIIELDRSRYILIDYFILDLKDKKVKLYNETIDENACKIDSFILGFDNLLKVEVKKHNDTKTLTLIPNEGSNIIIELDKYNRIKSYKNSNLKGTDDNFLRANKVLEEIELLNLEHIGDFFLYNNEQLKKIYFPNLRIIGNNFITKNIKMNSFYMPNIEIIGSNFLSQNSELEQLYMPNLTIVGSDFLKYNNKVKEVDFSSITTIGTNFMFMNNRLEELKLEKLTTIDNYFLARNEKIKLLELPNLNKIGNGFLFYNLELKVLNLPNLITVGYSFLSSNEQLRILSLPKVLTIGENFLDSNLKLEELNLPSLIETKDKFLLNNKRICKINLPNVISIGNDFLSSNIDLSEVEMPNLEEIKSEFLYSNSIIKKINMPNLVAVGDYFLYSNKSLVDVNMPRLIEAGTNFIDKNKKISSKYNPKAINKNEKVMKLKDRLFNSWKS